MSFDKIEKSHQITRVLTVVGLWPKLSANQECPRYWRCYQLLLHTTLTLLITVLMWLDVLWADNLDHAAQVLGYALTETAFVLKILNIWWYERLAVQLLHEWATSDAFALRTSEERCMWQRMHRTFGRVYFSYCGVSINSVFFGFLAAPFMKAKRLPFSYWVPEAWRERYFWCTFGCEFVALPFTCLCNIHLDLLNSFMLLHLATSLDVIGMRLKQLANEGDNASDEQITAQLVSIMKQHQRIRRNAAHCERIISLPILVQILLTSFVLCFAIYRLQSVHLGENPGDFYVILLYVMAMSLQIFIPCYYANRVTTSAQQLTHCLFSANWTRLSRKNRRLVLLSMESLSQPLIFRAGGFFEIGLPIFSKTMNNAYSLLALLLNVSDENV